MATMAKSFACHKTDVCGKEVSSLVVICSCKAARLKKKWFVLRWKSTTCARWLMKDLDGGPTDTELF